MSPTRSASPAGQKPVTVGPPLPDVVQAIVDEFDPIGIILFGSLARGDEHDDSDIDLVVVMPQVDDKHAAAVAVRRATASLPDPLGVIAVDEAEVQRRRDEIGSVLHRALRAGEVVKDARASGHDDDHDFAPRRAVHTAG